MTETQVPPHIINRVREWLRPRVDKGVECPCCTQFVKVYDKRQITAGMARVLIAMYHDGGDENGYVHITKFRHIEKGGDTAKLRFWGLIEPMPGRRQDGSTRVGWWRVTNLGKSYVRGTTSVPKYAREFKSNVQKLHGEPRTIRDALGEKFNYDELMS